MNCSSEEVTVMVMERRVRIIRFKYKSTLKGGGTYADNQTIYKFFSLYIYLTLEPDLNIYFDYCSIHLICLFIKENYIKKDHPN